MKRCQIASLILFFLPLFLLTPLLAQIHMTWDSTARIGARWSERDRHTSVVFDDKIWVLGGFDGTYKNDVWYSSDGVNWNLATSNAPWSPRFNHTSVVFDGKIWVLGGHDGALRNDVWYSSDGTNWTLVTSNAGWSGRSGHTSVVFDDKIWVLGGHDGARRNDVWYSSDGVNWTLVTSNAGWSGRSGHTSVVFDDKIWVLGGYTSPTSKNDVWYSSNGLTWTEATSNAEWLPRTEHTSVVFANKIWVLSGYEGLPCRADVWCSPNGINWDSTQRVDRKWLRRRDHTSVVFDDKIWVLGGFDSLNNYRNDIWYSSELTINDVGCARITAPIGTIDSASLVAPACTVGNYGTTTVSCSVRMRIGDFFTTTTWVSNLIPNEKRYVQFPPTIAHWPRGTHAISCSTKLTGDMNTGNDKKTGSVTVQVVDVGCTEILAPIGAIDSGTVVTPKVKVKNFGEITVTFDATFYIEGTKWSSTKTVEDLTPDEERTVDFDDWTADALGRFATRCTTKLTGDRYTENDRVSDTFIVRGASPPPLTPWQKLTEGVPTEPDGKNVKSGGLIINGGNKIYIVKGNNTKSFYSYVPGTRPVYFDSVRITGKRGVKKGTGMVFDGNRYLYFVPGTNTNQFWRYDTTNKTWETLPSVPLGPKNKKLKGGTGIAYVNGKVYLLKGSKTREFLCYEVGGGWDTLPSAPEVAKPGKGYGDGSCLITYNNNTLYALRGRYNEFFKYNVNHKSWSTESIMPFVHPMVKKRKKVGEGASMVLKDGKIYAFKGNNTKEFWMFDPTIDRWIEKETIPKGEEKKYVKGGGGLCLFDGTIYALKGNNRNVIYRYTGTGILSASSPNTGIMGSLTEKKRYLVISPNPTKGLTTVYYNLPAKEVATLKIYNVLGEVVYSAKTNKGLFTIRRLPAGIYLLRFNAKGYKEERKLVVIK